MAHPFSIARSHPRRSAWLLAAAIAAVVGAGCEKKVTVTQTPTGTVTTTTISATAQASQALRQIDEKVSSATSAIDEKMSHAASAIESSSGPGASQALTKAGDAIEDSVVTAKVKAGLLADPDVKGLQIDVETNHGIVTLAGTVDKSANLDRAVRIARDTGGVKSVDNRLVVKATT